MGSSASTFRICFCTVQQFHSTNEFTSLFKKLPTKSTDFFVFPEACFEGDKDREYGDWDEHEQRNFLNSVSDVAKTYNVYIAVTCPVYDPETKLMDSHECQSQWFNRCTIFGRDGKIIAKHNKYDLCDGERRFYSRTKRSGATLFDLPELNFPIGVLICRDLWNGCLTRSAMFSECKLLFAPVYCATTIDEVPPEKRPDALKEAADYYARQLTFHYHGEYKKNNPTRRLNLCIVDQPYLNAARRQALDPPLGVTSVIDIDRDKVRKIYLPAKEKENQFYIDIDCDNGRIKRTFTECI